MARRRVVVTGTGVVSSVGDSRSQLHAALCERRSGLKPVELFGAPYLDDTLAGEISSFDAENYLGSDRNLRPLNRTAQLLASGAALALNDSGWTAEQIDAETVGLVAGTTFCSVRTISEFDCRALTEGPSRTSPLDFANTVINAAAGQAAIWHKLRGVNSSISTGITSGIDAIAYAAGLIREGHETAILAGGVEEMCTESLLGFQRAGLLRTSGAANSSGINLAEGCGLLMLEDYETAVDRGATVVAEIKGHGSCFACHEDGLSTAIGRAIEDAIAESQVAYESIECGYLSANGHEDIDQVESSLLGDRFDWISLVAPKEVLGESLGASGAISTIALIEALVAGTLPKVMDNDGDTEPARSCSPKHGFVNAVGLDGNCSTLVVGKA